MNVKSCQGEFYQRGVMLIDAAQAVTSKITLLKTRVSFAHLTRWQNHLVERGEWHRQLALIAY